MSPGRVDTPYDALTYQIIGCCMAAHRSLGSGHREEVYQRDLIARFTSSGLAVLPEPRLEVFDKEQANILLGFYIPDFIVADKVVVEIKALSGLDNAHVAQVIGYLALTSCPLGLLINFGARSLQYRRIFPPKNISDHAVNRQWLWVPDGWNKGPTDARA